MTMGRPDATSVPNTSSRSTIVSGIAMDSARTRSFSMVEPTLSNAGPVPATPISRGPSAPV